MFSAEDRLFSGGYGGGYAQGTYGITQGYDNYSSISEACIGSDLVFCGPLMAEEESKTESTLNEGAAAESSSNKDQQQQEERDDEGWLKLSIGGGNSQEINDQTPRKEGAGLVELELLPSSSSNNNNNNNNNSISSHSQMRPLGPIHEFRAPRAPVMNFGTSTPTGFSPSFFLQSSTSSSFPHQHQENINWAFRPMMPINMATAPNSSASFSSPSSLMAPGSYFSRPFQLYAGVDMAAQGPSLDFRVIPPPRRPHSGIWFILQASHNQEKEPFLPQISKSYLRIKDGRMTIRLVMKYLVNKLTLENESEIEIRCKGQRLLPFLTLQHVRDNIWSERDSFITLLPNSSTTDHIMVLHYGRIASN